MSSNFFKPNGIFIYQVSRPLYHLNLRFNELRLKVCQALLVSLSRLMPLAYTCVDQVHSCASVPTLHCPHITCVYEVLERLWYTRTCATVLYDHDRLQRASHRLKQGLLRVFLVIVVFHCRFPFRCDSYTRRVSLIQYRQASTNGYRDIHQDTHTSP